MTGSWGYRAIWFQHRRIVGPRTRLVAPWHRTKDSTTISPMIANPSILFGHSYSVSSSETKPRVCHDRCVCQSGVPDSYSEFLASGEMCEHQEKEGIIVFRSIRTSDYECRKDHLLCVTNFWGKIDECGNAEPCV